MKPEVHGGLVWCHAPHPTAPVLHFRYFNDSGPMAFPTFGQWLFHRLWFHNSWWPGWMELARIGFIDCEPYGDPPRYDGGDRPFWRWDFWNSGLGKEFREIRDRENESRVRMQRRAEEMGRRA